MTFNYSFKNIAPSILLGSAIGCGISYVMETLVSKPKSYEAACCKDIKVNNQSAADNAFDMVCDSEGYNKYGYDSEGFSRSGYDVEGFGRDYFNIKGFDRSNRNRRYYMNYLARLYSLKEESLRLLADGSYRYALLNSRTIVDDTLSLLLGHALGNSYQGAKISTKLKVCEEYSLIGDNKEFINGLRGVCRICSPRMHTIDNENEITHQQVYFTIMQSMELLQMAEKNLLMS